MYNLSFSGNTDVTSTDIVLKWCTDPCPPVAVRACSIFICILTAIVNTSAIVIINRDSELKRTIAGMLMTSMSLSGIVQSIPVGIFSLCITSVYLTRNTVLCILTHVISNTNATVALSTIAALALDRLIAISFHLRYNSIITTHKCVVFITLQWLICLGCNLPPVFIPDTVWCVKRFGGCGFQKSQASVIVLALVIYLPSILGLLISYIKIGIVLHRMRSVYPNHRGRNTGIRTTVMITLVFFACTLPVLVYAFYSPYMISDDHWFEDLAAITFQLSSLLSTITYCGTNKRFKFKLRQLVGHIFGNVQSDWRSRKVSPGIWTIVSGNF